MIFVWILLGFLIGAGVISVYTANARHAKDKETLALSEERAELRGRLASMQALLEAANRQIQDEKEEAAVEITQVKKDAESRIKEIREEADRRVALTQRECDHLREENEEQWQLRFDKLREEFKGLTADTLASRQSALQETNREQMDELLRPIREQFEQFRKAVDETRTSGEVTKNELKSTFESTMKLFREQQKMTVEELRRETSRIGEDAANLTRVLRRDTKVQGNWGEMILDTLLESSGLERDVHYFVQDNVKDENGDNLRPDVVVRFPEGRAVIIDSKVSLTAYVEAFATDDETIRQRKLKEHANSVRKHIDELANKKYDDLVEDAVSFVLMFIPNDQCYLAAMEKDKSLGTYAYSRGIVIISPSNLLIALQLSYNMWQKHRQDENILDIVKAATGIYEKAVNFTESFLQAEKQLITFLKTFDTARKQLFRGQDNFLQKLEKLKSKGITPKKSLKGLGAKSPALPILDDPSEDLALDNSLLTDTADNTPISEQSEQSELSDSADTADSADSAENSDTSENSDNHLVDTSDNSDTSDNHLVDSSDNSDTSDNSDNSDTSDNSETSDNPIVEASDNSETSDN